MQLVLANTTDTKGNVGRAASGNEILMFGFTVTVDVEVKRSTGVADNDAQHNLISEMTLGQHCSISVMTFHSHRDIYNVALFDAEGKGNVLRHIGDRFQDKVRISIEVNSGNLDPDGDSVCCIFAAGTVFKQLNNDYSWWTSPLDKLDLDGLSRNSSFQVKIIAHVSDDPVLVSNAYQLKKTYEKMLEEGVGSDTVIEAGNGVRIKTHKCFLIATSSVFEKMFESGMTEAKNGRIDMTDISEEGIRAFLRYLYLGDVIVPNASIAVAYDLLYAAHKYDVPKLEATMKTYLVGREYVDFPVTQAFEIYLFVKGIETAAELKEKMVRVLQTKYDELKELEEFKEVLLKCPANVMEICNKIGSAPEEGEIVTVQNDIPVGVQDLE